MTDTILSTRQLAGVALAAGTLAASYLAGALTAPFATSGAAPAQPTVRWHPRAVTLDGKRAERPFGQVMAALAATPPWRRSARTLSAAEIADLLGRPSGAAIAPKGQATLLQIRPVGRPQLCAQYLSTDHSWSLVFCS
jgi:hypothetical protein